MENDNLWTARELAKFLAYSESTIARMISQCPDRLPPRVASLGRPRWLPEVAREWARINSETVVRRTGRPRNLR